MSRSTISTFQLFALFPDEETARVYLEGRIWPNGPVCPVCRNRERVSALGACSTRKPGFYRCLACEFDFTVRTNTVMERSKVPLHKWLYAMWLYAMYLVVTARKGVSSLQLAKEIGITQKSAWFVLGRLREACGGDGPDSPLYRKTNRIQGACRMNCRHRFAFGNRDAERRCIDCGYWCCYALSWGLRHEDDCQRCAYLNNPQPEDGISA